MDAETLHRWQERQLIYQVNYVYESSPFYKWFYQRHRVDIGKVTSMEQFQQRIPIVRKDDLREYQELTGDPYAGLCCVPREQLVHTWVSSGTTGMPTLGGYTREDMAIAIEVYARNAYGSGLYRPGMRMLCSTAAWHWISPLYWILGDDAPSRIAAGGGFISTSQPSGAAHLAHGTFSARDAHQCQQRVDDAHSA